MKELAPWLWIGAIALIFWLIIIRPAAKRQRQVVELQQGLAIGDDVVLTSGIFATVVDVAESHLEVQVAEGVVLRIARGAVASVRSVEPEIEQADTDDAESEHRDENEER